MPVGKCPVVQPLVRFVGLACMLIVLAGCASAAITGATLAVKGSQRTAANKELAAKGDPVALTRLGISHCCRGIGFSTQKATEFLCQAAHQDHGPAQFELGRIYAGDIARVYEPGQIIINSITAPKRYDLAMMWFKLAEQNGDRRATRRLDFIRSRMPEGWVPKRFEGESDRLLRTWKRQPCEYRRVFPREAAEEAAVNQG